MSFTVKQTNVPLWHYTCPDCGFGSEDTGYHAQEHMIYCEICLEDSRHVKLRRWSADDDASGAPPSGRLSGA